MVPTSDDSASPARPSAVGRIQGICVPELFHDLCRSARTGTLRLRRPGAAREVWFEDGRIVHAVSDDPDDGLGAILVREGRITLDQLGPDGTTTETDEALRSRLLDAGAFTRRDLERVILSRVCAIVASVFRWDEGDYEFHDRPAVPCPTRVDVTTSELIVEGVRRSRSFEGMRSGVGAPQTRYKLAADFDARLEGLAPSEAERLVLESLRNGPRMVEALCLELYLSNFEVYQALWVFRILRAIEVVEPAAVATDVRASGRLDSHEFVGVLVRLCRDGETGVLHASSAGIDRSFHIKEGRCVFATSTNPDDSLVAHLFRRGVISLNDREEVGRRMLTNKRVGTILLDMGVIDANDLDRMVREQITEILNDTVRWRTGDFWFAPGELPTLEEITLVSSLEDLVAQAVRTLPAWSRVLQGVGGPDARFELSPSYLDVLDRMTVGGDEWDLVALLAQPRTVREVCRASGLGDFSVCRTLWSLHLLGAVAHARDVVVEAAPAERALPERPSSIEREHSDEPVFVAPAVVVDASVTEAATIEFPAVPEPSLPVLTAMPVDPVPVVAIEVSESPSRDSWRVETPASTLTPETSTPETLTPETLTPETFTPETITLEAFMPETAAPEAIVAPSIPEPRFEPVAPILAEPPREVSTADPGKDRALADLAAAQLARVSSFELDAPGCDTEPYMAEMRPAKVRPTDEDRLPLDPETERRIEWLNACQQTVYRVVRSEVGAGAANFVRFCGEKLPDGFGAVFSHVELQDDGSWDLAGLRAALRRERPGDLQVGFQRLLDKELEMVQVHLGAERANTLRRKIVELENAATT